MRTYVWSMYTDACNRGVRAIGSKTRENVIGRKEKCWEHCATSSQLWIMRRTDVTKATQSIHTQTTASLIHRSCRYWDPKTTKKPKKSDGINQPNHRLNHSEFNSGTKQENKKTGLHHLLKMKRNEEKSNVKRKGFVNPGKMGKQNSYRSQYCSHTKLWGGHSVDGHARRHARKICMSIYSINSTTIQKRNVMCFAALQTFQRERKREEILAEWLACPHLPFPNLFWPRPLVCVLL